MREHWRFSFRPGKRGREEGGEQSGKVWRASIDFEVLKLQCSIFLQLHCTSHNNCHPPCFFLLLSLLPYIVTRNFSGLAQGVDLLIRSFGACNSSKYPVNIMFAHVQ